MPPRYAYWTILVDGQPTAFRAAEIDELLPTLKRLQVKQPTAELKWFEKGRLWPSRDEARDLLRRGFTVAPDGSVVPPADAPARGKGWRPGGDHRDPREKFQAAKKAKWQKFKQMVRSRPGHGTRPDTDAPPPTDEFAPHDEPQANTPPEPPATDWRGRPIDPEARPRARAPKPGGGPRGPKPAWRDRDDSRPAARGPKPAWRDRPAKPWSDRPPKPRGPKPEWQDRGPKPAWRDRDDSRPAARGPKPAWRDRPAKPWSDRPPKPRGPKPEWQDRGPKPRGPKPARSEERRVG
ncbi:MAG: hypothetical protein AB7U25_18350, partial [Vicinamibacterales bacterium]